MLRCGLDTASVGSSSGVGTRRSHETWSSHCQRMSGWLAQAARVYRRCRPPTWGIAMTFTLEGCSTRRGCGALRSRERWVSITEIPSGLCFLPTSSFHRIRQQVESHQSDQGMRCCDQSARFDVRVHTLGTGRRANRREVSPTPRGGIGDAAPPLAGWRSPHHDPPVRPRAELASYDSTIGESSIRGNSRSTR